MLYALSSHNQETYCIVCGIVDFINEDGLCPTCEENAILNGNELGDNDL